MRIQYNFTIFSIFKAWVKIICCAFFEKWNLIKLSKSNKAVKNETEERRTLESEIKNVKEEYCLWCE